MNRVSVRITNRTKHPLPAYQTTGSAGMDLRAALDEPVILEPGERRLIPTGIAIALPEGYEAQVRPRSGLAFKYGIGMVNAPGTIDADYRGEIGVLLINHGQEAFKIADGERVAQLVVAPVTQVDWQLAGSLESTVRGAGGFGHTGT
jgi:dUTP pyrophosphatase